MKRILLESNEQKWKEISENAFYRSYIDEMKEAADRLLFLPVEPFRYSEYHMYQVDGNRLIYENNYFARRRRLCVFSIIYKITGEKKYLEALEDAVWAVCDEFTWSLPAHVPSELPVQRQEVFLDLFSCETGAALAEIDYLLHEELSAPVQERLRYEVRRRIVDAFLFQNLDNRWEHMDNNWAAVCAGAVGMAFLYQGSEQEVDAAMPRLMECLKNFLSGFTEDGACLEGYTYWWYGFVFYTMFASLYQQYTDGKVNLLKGEKVHKIAQFQQKVLIGRNLSLTFSDNNILKFSHDRALSHFLYHHFDDIQVPPDEFHNHFGQDHCFRYGPCLRNFLWTDPELSKAEWKKRSFYFPDAQWYIKNTCCYSVTAKGGDNGEPHNHNDLGSFCISTPSEYLLCDLGAGEYVADYFKDETRYSFLVNSSRGHSVPLIGSHEQAAGKNARAKVLNASEDCFELELAGAYGLPELKSFVRKLECASSRSIVLEDRFWFQDASLPVTERFITTLKPVVTAEGVKIAAKGLENNGEELLIVCENEEMYPVITEEVYTGHHGEPLKAYKIDYVAAASGELSCRFCFVLS